MFPLPPRRSGALLCGLLLVGLSAPRAAAEETVQASAHAEVRLVAEREHAVRGTTLSLGVLVRPEAGWHVYWQNPGDAGLPVEVAWHLPPGLVASPPSWPLPTRHDEGPLVTWVHEAELLLASDVAVPAGLSTDVLRIEATVRWLACRDICVPGEARLALELPVTDETAPPPGPWAGRFDAARAQRPRRLAPARAEAEAHDGEVVLVDRGLEPAPRAGEAWYVAPLEPGPLEGAGQRAQLAPDGAVRVAVPLARGAEVPFGIRGVLLRPAEATGYALDVTVVRGEATRPGGGAPRAPAPGLLWAVAAGAAAAGLLAVLLLVARARRRGPAGGAQTFDGTKD